MFIFLQCWNDIRLMLKKQDEAQGISYKSKPISIDIDAFSDTSSEG